MMLLLQPVAVAVIASSLVAAAPLATQHENTIAVQGSRPEIPTPIVDKINQYITPPENNWAPGTEEVLRPHIAADDLDLGDQSVEQFWRNWLGPEELDRLTDPHSSVEIQDSEGTDDHKQNIDPSLVELLNQRFRVAHSKIRTGPALSKNLSQKANVDDGGAPDGENDEEIPDKVYVHPMLAEKLNQRVRLGDHDPADYNNNEKYSNGTKIDFEIVKRLTRLNLLPSIYTHTTDGTDTPSRPIIFGNGTTAFVSKRVETRGIQYYPGTKCPTEPTMGSSICINILNATPYRWRRGYGHAYQVSGWMEGWPEYIEPGQSVGHLAEQDGGVFKQDSAAEVFYHLEGTKKPMSISIEYRNGHTHYPYARFREELEAKKVPKNADFQIGSGADGVGLILAGEEGDFVTNAGAEAWMQSMMEELGDRTLREIVLPRSHHAGMYKESSNVMVDTAATMTQRVDLYHQLRDSGVRVVDVRTMRDNGKQHEDGDMYRDYHGMKLPFMEWAGTNGASFNDLIEQTNAFNDEFPGELVIWDLHASDAVSKFEYGSYPGDSYWGPLNGTSLAEIMQLLKTLKHRVRLPKDKDITQIPLKSLIGDKKSAVIVRIDTSWVDKLDPKDWPGQEEGFVSTAHFPAQERWSETSSVRKMIWDQLDAMNKAEVSRVSPVYNMQWILSLPGKKSVFFSRGLVRLSQLAMERVFHEMFDGLTEDRYPNWITFDGLRGTEARTIAMAINKCFVARKCGDWTKRS